MCDLSWWWLLKLEWHKGCIYNVYYIYIYTSSTRTSRGRKFPPYKKHKPIRTLGPIEKNHPPALSLTCLIDPHRIWNVIYNARSDRHHLATSPNTAPATQKECHDWSASHMKRHLQCAERQASPCNLTKYCACHAKGVSWLIRITYETSFTMRGATGITLQPHQILRLPRKRNVMIDPHHIWNVIYNARSDRHHPATSPNTAPATQNYTSKS